MGLQIKFNTVDEILCFTRLALKHEGDVLVKHNSFTVDGTSVLGILSLDLSEPVTVIGIDESELTDAGLKIYQMGE